MLLTEKENKEINTHRKIEIIALTIAIVGVLLPLSSMRIISDWGDDGWTHTTVIRFFYNVFTNEYVSIANMSMWILIRNVSYLVAIVLLSIQLINAIEGKDKLKKSSLWIAILVCLGVVVSAHIIFNLSNPISFSDINIQIQRRLSFGFYVTLVGTLVPIYLRYTLSRNVS